MKKGWFIVLAILLVVFMGISTFLFVDIYRLPKQDLGNDKTKDKAIIFNTGSPFITNIKETRSILKCEIYIEVLDKETAEYLQKDIPRIRDRIIIILRNLTADDINAQDIQAQLKDDIKLDLKENLGAENITDIYFNEFVVQY